MVELPNNKLQFKIIPLTKAGTDYNASIINAKFIL